MSVNKQIAFEYRQRNELLKEMGFSSYRDYLDSDLWREIKRKKLTKTVAVRCRICLRNNATTLHHTSYDQSVMTGEDLEPLVPICRWCHKAIEFDGERKVERLAQVNRRMIARAGKFHKTFTPTTNTSKGRKRKRKKGRTKLAPAGWKRRR